MGTSWYSAGIPNNEAFDSGNCNHGVLIVELNKSEIRLTPCCLLKPRKVWSSNPFVEYVTPEIVYFLDEHYTDEGVRYHCYGAFERWGSVPGEAEKRLTTFTVYAGIRI